MSSIVEQARVAVTLDGRDAGQALNELTADVNKYTDALLKAYEAGDKNALKKSISDLKTAEANLASFKKQTFEVSKVLNNLNGSSLNELKRAEKEINSEMVKMTRGTKDYIAANNNLVKVRSEISKVKTEMGGISKQTKVLSGIKSLLPALSIAALVSGIKNLVSNIIDVRKEFEKYNAVLTNSLGSEKEARIQMNMLKEIASQTPFSINELTESYVKLVGQGFKPTNEEILKLGDLASSTGKSFDQMTEAILDAQNGEFERLKEFGIRAQKSGDQVVFTFKGVKQTVDFTSESIRNYIVKLGESEGVTGAMSKISETLGGQISNVKDNWTLMLDNLGSNSSGIFSTVTGWLKSLSEEAITASKSIEQIRLEVADENWINTIKADRDEIDKNGEVFIKTLNIQLDAQKKRLESGIKNIDQLVLEKEVYGEVRSAAIFLDEKQKDQLKTDIELTQNRVSEANRYILKTKEQVKETVILTEKQKKEIEEQKKRFEDELKAREKVIADISGLEDEYLREKMTKEEQEIFAVTDKYNRIWEAAVNAKSSQEVLDRIEADGKIALDDLLKEQQLEKETKFQEERQGLREQLGLVPEEELMNEELDALAKMYEGKIGYEKEYQNAKAAIEAKYKLIKDKNQADELADQVKHLNELKDKAEDYAGFVADLLVKSLEDGKITQQEALKILTLTLLKALKNTIITSIASSTAQSFAQPDSVATFGATGAIRAGILIGLIEAAYQGIEGLLMKNVGQAKKGRYNVTGADDGRHYSADYYGTVSNSGIINNGMPTLINEQGGEYIATAGHVNRVLSLNPRLFHDFDSYKVSQRAEGRYFSGPNNSNDNIEKITKVMESLILTNQQLNISSQNMIIASQNMKAKVVLSELEDAQKKKSGYEDFAAGR